MRIDDEIKRQIEKEIEEERILISLADELELNQYSYLSRKDLKNAIFCKSKVYYTVGMYCAIAKGDNIDPLSFESFKELECYINDLNRTYDYLGRYREFIYPDGVRVVGSEEEGGETERLTSQIALNAGILTEGFSDDMEILNMCIGRFQYVRKTGFLCAFLIAKGENPYVEYTSFRSLERRALERGFSFTWPDESIICYRSFCDEFFERLFNLSEADSVGKNKEPGEGEKKFEELMDIMNGKIGSVDFDQEDLMELTEDELEELSECMKDITDSIYGFSELCDLIDKTGIRPDGYQTPAEFIVAVLSKCEDLDLVDDKALIHMMGLLTNAPIEYVHSNSDMMNILYTIYFAEYTVGEVFAKAYDMGKDPFKIESPDEISDFIFENIEGNTPCLDSYRNMVGYNTLGYVDRGLGSAGRILRMFGKDTSGMNERDAIISVLESILNYESPGGICAIALDFGFNPYGDYESLAEMKDKTGFNKTFIEYAVEGKGENELERFAKYTEIEWQYRELQLSVLVESMKKDEE